jgi:hypothetical protein
MLKGQAGFGQNNNHIAMSLRHRCNVIAITLSYIFQHWFWPMGKSRLHMPVSAASGRPTPQRRSLS